MVERLATRQSWMKIETAALAPFALKRVVDSCCLGRLSSILEERLTAGKTYQLALA